MPSTWPCALILVLSAIQPACADRAVVDRADPTLVDGVGDAIGEHRGSQCLQVRIVAIHHLVPETAAGLVLRHAAQCRAQLRQCFFIAQMILGQHVQQIAHRQDRPSRRPPPIESRRAWIARIPTVEVEPLGRIEKWRRHRQHNAHRIVAPRAIAGEPAHLRQRRDSPVGVVGPQRLRLAAATGITPWEAR